MMRYVVPSSSTSMRMGCFAPNHISVSESVGSSEGDQIEKNGSHDTIGTLGGRNAADATIATATVAVSEMILRMVPTSLTFSFRRVVRKDRHVVYAKLLARCRLFVAE